MGNYIVGISDLDPPQFLYGSAAAPNLCCFAKNQQSKEVLK
jgi:hypothetical protein